jgi:glycosyltransferase involved in cell wall biosynthesis
MKVLWFEVTIPQNYNQHGFHGAGWQDSLENIVKKNSDIELGIAFETQNDSHENRKIDGVHYFPLKAKYSVIERAQSKYTWSTSRNKLIPLSLEAIKVFKPDVIHVFGSEWCYGQVAEYSDIPVIIHMQGSIPPYNNAFYPPGYNEWDEIIFNFKKFKWRKLIALHASLKKRKTWKQQEEKTLRLVNNYMGRTNWDRAIVNLYNPKARYFYCSEALRSSFIENARNWKPTDNTKIKLITTGCSSFWKGLDTIVRTAAILKEKKIDFEWSIAGIVANKELIEWKEKIKMEDVSIKFLGMIDSDSLLKHLLESDMYIHTAYIDNSPNSICEAQYLGLPIIATYVGGIPSLIDNNVDGLLIPANSPHTLANEIINLAYDKERQKQYSDKSKKKARTRHSPSIICENIHQIYNLIIKEKFIEC